MKKSIILFFLGLTCIFNTQAQDASIWKKITDAEVPLREENQRKLIPTKYDVWKINFQALKAKLDAAPMEMTTPENPLLMTLPLPEGKSVTLDIKESPVVHPALSRKYPTFKTFYGVGGNNNEYYARLDYTVDGFRAAINTPDGEVYIDPYATDMQNYIVVYYTADYLTHDILQKFACGVSHLGEVKGFDKIADNTAVNRGAREETVTLRKYRLALQATGEFTKLYGGTKDKVLAKMVALTNRVNKTTIPEVAIRFELIPNTDTLIWLNAATDPFPNGDVGKDILSKSHGVISQLVGNSNFDIGHSLTGNCSDVGGVAFAGVVCNNNSKGSGVTCDQSGGNTDALAVTIMCHEMGHQFSASHTMSSCGSGDQSQVNSSSFIEPGSGTTIMSYDGGCGSDNVTGLYWKPNGNYSVGSIGQILEYSRMSTGNSCPVKTDLGNNYPNVQILHQKTGLYIPRYTAFELTAAGGDPDNDKVTYSWEQSDSGSFMSLGSQNLYSNSFRVFPPVTTPTRTFPRLSSIISNVKVKDELYPDTSRLYTFVCTIRDNNPNGGGLDIDTIKFRSTHTAGPFAVTFPNAATDSVATGDYMTVKWDVANTNGNLVNCQQVNILLSIDGGLTYPIILLQKTANDGEEGVILPKGLTSTKARVRINAVDNIFFDISNKNFVIAEKGNVGYNMAVNTQRQKYCLPDTAILYVQTTTLGGYDSTVNLSIKGLPQGATASFDQNAIKAGDSTRVVIDMSKVTFQGNVTLSIEAISGTDTIIRNTTIKTVSVDFSAMAGTSPSNGQTAVNTRPTFQWSISPNAEKYDIQISTEPSFSMGLLNTSNNLTGSELISPITLTENTLYFWRIRAKNNCDVGNWSVAMPFHTLTQRCKEYTNNTSTNILTADANTINIDTNVEESGIISDVNVSSIKGTHSNFGDLIINLISPSNKTSMLSNRRCPFTGGSTLLLKYDDQATQTNKCDKLLSVGIPYIPETPLAVFNGEDTKGKWTLQVKDMASGNGGNIQEWTVRMCSSASVNAPTLIKNDTLKVRPNNGRFISDSLLLATDDKASANEILYTLVTLPKYGKLERWGGGTLAIGNTFTQNELNGKHAIRYVNTNSTASNDFFLFVITDGEGGFLGTLKYNIQISAKAPVSNTQNVALEKSIKVYPNPTRDILNVSMYEGLNYDMQIQLVNTTGQAVLQSTLSQGQTNATLETASLPAGMYLLKFDTPQGFATKRILIQR